MINGKGSETITMTTYQEICHQVENLTPDEQLLFLEEIASLIRRRVSSKPKRSIMELEGLGKEIWQGMDAQDYVDQKRASWNG
jgi:hypothetical protein